MTKVSVVMPVYQAEKFIENTCDNFSKQTLDEKELICVDDGSTDSTLEILEGLAKKYDFIKVLHQENQGSGFARNKGMENSKGEYISFLDADDIFIQPDALEKMYVYAKQNNADIVCGNLERVTEDFKPIGNFNYKEGNYKKFNEYGSENSEDYGIPWAFYKNIYKKEFLDDNNIRFINLQRGQDPVFLAEVLTKTDIIYTVPVDLYGYNFANGGGANSKVNDHKKKYDYMKHFQNTINILDEAKYSKMASSYKKQLVKYMSLHNNRHDKELFEIVHEVFEDNNPTYFKTFNEEMMYLQMKLINYNNPESFYYEFSAIKKDFLKHSLTKTHFVDPEITRTYIEITEVFEENFRKDAVEHKELKQLNKSILKSKSWTITKPIRKTGKVTVNALKKIKAILVKL